MPFTDVGMGVYKVDDGARRPCSRHHQHARSREEFASRLSPSGDGERHEYAQNIQIAELNSLNATIAVIRWKKIFGFYLDLEHEHHTVYAIDGNPMINEAGDGEAYHDQPRVRRRDPRPLRRGRLYVCIPFTTAVHMCSAAAGTRWSRRSPPGHGR